MTEHKCGRWCAQHTAMGGPLDLAVPDPGFRDKLAGEIDQAGRYLGDALLRIEELARHLGARGYDSIAWADRPPEQQMVLDAYSLVHVAQKQLAVAAEVQAQVQAAANRRPRLREQMQAARIQAWDEGYEACRHGDQQYRNPYRAAALDTEGNDHA